MKKKILFVVTSHGQKGTTGEPTGYYLSEVSHPWEILVNAGYEIDFVSPQGGKAPVDGFNLGDSINKKFWENNEYRYKIEHTLSPEEVDPSQYVAIHYAGGHGAMWDLADNAQLAAIAANIYEHNGVLSAVCHGPAGLVNVRLSNGKYLVDGKQVNAFTNEEEVAVKLDKVVPFALETKLIERGAHFEKSGLWQTHVTVDQGLVTGQNPQSAKAVGEAVRQQLENRKLSGRLTRFELQANYLQAFRKALNTYVAAALSREGNVMAEAFLEPEHPTTLWLMERWNDQNLFDQMAAGAEAKALQSLSKTALTQNPEIIAINDLEPLTSHDWRRAPEANDQPILVMLFVEAKTGTEQDFRDLYHQAILPFRSEPGVITYQISQFDNDPTRFVTYEKFRNEAAFQYHLQFPAIQPVLHYLENNVQQHPFQKGLHQLIGFTPMPVASTKSSK